MDWIFEINDDGTMTQVYENLRYIDDGDLNDLLLSGPDVQGFGHATNRIRVTSCLTRWFPYVTNAMKYFIQDRSSWGLNAKQLTYINVMVWYSSVEQFNSEFDASVAALSDFCQDVDRSHGCFWANHVEVNWNGMDLMTKHMRETFAPGLPGMYFLCNSDLGEARLSEIQGSHFLPIMHEYVLQIILNKVWRSVISPSHCVPWGVFEHVCYANDYSQDGCQDRGDWVCPYLKECRHYITHFEGDVSDDDDGGSGLTDPGGCYGTPTFAVLSEVEAAFSYLQQLFRVRIFL
jgi:hypothetical protein